MFYKQLQKLEQRVNQVQTRYLDETKDDESLRRSCDLVYSMCVELLDQVIEMAPGVEQHRGMCNGMRLVRDGALTVVKEKYRQRCMKEEISKEAWHGLASLCDEHLNGAQDMFHQQREAFVQYAGKVEGFKGSVIKHLERIEKMLDNKRKKEETPDIPEDKMDRMAGLQRLPGMESPADRRRATEAKGEAEAKTRPVKRTRTRKKQATKKAD